MEEMRIVLLLIARWFDFEAEPDDVPKSTTVQFTDPRDQVRGPSLL
jgi:hypothetical protein